MKRSPVQVVPQTAMNVCRDVKAYCADVASGYEAIVNQTGGDIKVRIERIVSILQKLVSTSGATFIDPRAVCLDLHLTIDELIAAKDRYTIVALNIEQPETTSDGALYDSDDILLAMILGIHELETAAARLRSVYWPIRPSSDGATS